MSRGLGDVYKRQKYSIRNFRKQIKDMKRFLWLDLTSKKAYRQTVSDLEEEKRKGAELCFRQAKRIEELEAKQRQLTMELTAANKRAEEWRSMAERLPLRGPRGRFAKKTNQDAGSDRM